MGQEHQEEHVTPPNRNKPNTHRIVKEAQEEYKKISKDPTPGHRVRPGKTFGPSKK